MSKEKNISEMENKKDQFVALEMCIRDSIRASSTFTTVLPEVFREEPRCSIHGLGVLVHGLPWLSSWDIQTLCLSRLAVIT